MILIILRWLAFAASLSLLLVYFQGGTTLVRDVRRSVADAGNYYYAFFSAVMGFAGLVILISQLLVCVGYLQTFREIPEGLAAAGAVLAVAAILTSYWIRARYLGRFWSGNVEVKPDHRIVENGPYRIIRHPIYACAVAIYSGIAPAFAVGWIWLACGIMIAGYFILGEYEDRFLAKNLTGYSEYRKRTVRKIIPGIW
jgi:protein-S-isoprenylcysteine O-methyltransferase Ste14